MWRQLIAKAPARIFSRALYMCVNKDIMPALRVKHVPLFDDNYCWQLVNEVSGESVLVDPADCTKVLSIIGKEYEVAAALITHKHWDHAGGTKDLAASLPGIKIFAGSIDSDAIEAVTDRLADGDEVSLAGFSVRALHTPCHTKGHTCYVVTGDTHSAPAVFTGDTLFAGGCGKFFEGSAKDMHDSLAKLSTLPEEALIYCGHEYTVSNLLFCLAVEPENETTKARLAAARALRESGKPTVPTKLREELATNVFLRLDSPAVRKFIQQAGEDVHMLDRVEVLRRLREAKNGWKPT